jgi:hypothetical protein
MKIKINTLWAIFLMANVLFLLAGCKNDSKEQQIRDAEKMYGINPGMPIHIIVPVGFRGQIQITEDQTNGIVPSIKDGTIVIDIPTNGCVALKDWSFYFVEHHESASYADGTSIPDPDMTPRGQEFPRDKVGYYTPFMELGTTHPKKTLVSFVGTKDELDQLK